MARLLVVDDNEDVRFMTRVVFQDTAVDVVGEATNGIEAIEMCDSLQPDYVLMDVIMPEMGGVEATRRIRERWPQIVVLGFTASGIEAVHEMVQAGAAAVFEKSRFAELVTHLREWAG